MKKRGSIKIKLKKKIGYFVNNLFIFINKALGDILNNALEHVTLTSFTEGRELEKLFQKESGQQYEAVCM